MYFKESAIIAVGLIVIIPLIGFAVNYVITGILQLLCGLISRSGKLYLFFANRLTFPGVVWHELSHALFAFLTGAKVEEISLYHQEGNHLGYVKFRPRGIWPAQCVQLSLSACAPVIMGALGLSAIHIALTTLTLPVWGIVIAGYLFISIMIHMDMSPEDLKSYIKGIPFFLIVFFLVAYVYLSTNPEILTTLSLPTFSK